MRPWVQSPVLPKKKKKREERKENQYCHSKEFESQTNMVTKTMGKIIHGDYF
jgi:hypothetical protein